MSDWKYVIFEKGLFQVPVLFPSLLVHADVAHAVMPVLLRGDTNRGRIVSAGSIPAPIVPGAYGKSETLQMSARPCDRTIINTVGYSPSYVPDMSEQIERVCVLAHAKAVVETFR